MTFIKQITNISGVLFLLFALLFITSCSDNGIVDNAEPDFVVDDPDIEASAVRCEPLNLNLFEDLDYQVRQISRTSISFFPTGNINIQGSFEAVDSTLGQISTFVDVTFRSRYDYASGHVTIQTRQGDELSLAVSKRPARLDKYTLQLDVTDARGIGDFKKYNTAEGTLTIALTETLYDAEGIIRGSFDLSSILTCE